MPDLTIQSTLPLSNTPGAPRIPQLGLGVFQIEDGATCDRAVRTALDSGYRHIDTAAIYGNEKAVGTAVAESGLARDELFITTKCWIDDFGRGATRKACEASLRKLRMDYVDLYLLHWPIDDTMMAAWEDCIALREEGKCRSIGVSNFTVRRFEETFLPQTDVVPAANQVEIHPFGHRADVRAYCREKGIVVESYSPLARAQRFDHPEIRAVALEVERTPAQVLVRWNLQHGLVVLPKSAHEHRIRENADVYDFELTPGQMQRLDALEEDLCTIAWRPGGQKNWY